MDAKRPVRVIHAGSNPSPRSTARRLTRSRPRAFVEWETLRRWGRLPAWEGDVAGYRLRSLREAAGLTQTQLAIRLGVTQQAVAQVERWESNPTIELLRRWAGACGATLEIRLEPKPA
jgi:DNA-binding XRE family transcriptional regulator